MRREWRLQCTRRGPHLLLLRLPTNPTTAGDQDHLRFGIHRSLVSRVTTFGSERDALTIRERTAIIPEPPASNSRVSPFHCLTLGSFSTIVLTTILPARSKTNRRSKVSCRHHGPACLRPEHTDKRIQAPGLYPRSCVLLLRQVLVRESAYGYPMTREVAPSGAVSLADKREPCVHARCRRPNT